MSFFLTKGVFSKAFFFFVEGFFFSEEFFFKRVRCFSNWFELFFFFPQGLEFFF